MASFPIISIASVRLHRNTMIRMRLCPSSLRRLGNHSWMMIGRVFSTHQPPPQQSSSQQEHKRKPSSTLFLDQRDDNENADDDDADDAEEDYSRRKLEPWKTLLEMPARAAWRVSAPHPPLALSESLQTILSNESVVRVSNKQLYRIHQENIIQSQRALANRRERERQRAVSGREYRKVDMKRDASVQPVLYGPEEALAALKFRLYPNFSIVKRVLQESKSLMGEFDNDRDGTDKRTWTPTRVIDFGIGNGSASAAALDVWKDDIEWIHGIDSSQTMRDGAKALLEGFCEKRHDDATNGNPPSRSPPRLTLSAHLSAEAASLPAFDLALFAYTATELTHGSAILAAAAILWEKLLPNGLFVMIEPGTPDGFMNVRTVRNMLLDCFPPNNNTSGHEEQEECHILAPCTHNGKCPMERYHRRGAQKSTSSSQYLDDDENGKDEDIIDSWSDGDDDDDDANVLQVQGTKVELDDDDDDDDETMSKRKGFCSFVQTMPGTSSHGLMRSKGEKFSYLVAQKRIRGQFVEPTHRFHGINLAGLLLQTTQKQAHSSVGDTTNYVSMALDLESRFLDSDDDPLGLEFLRGDANRASFGRIIHAPKKKRGHVLIDCCTSPGQLVRHNISKSMSNAAPGLYTAARKSRWGGYWPRMDKSD